ncbi:hypothetical protein LMG29660_01137 [Burkholderia puraquae]|uniref:LysR substrate-binding domain-containing protein n=1 Tax=Burkholderia puraquae TaxID=1904757 RepID=A0A6J5DBC7_9BURK|nr:hypothetical protein LMG29660_01137 [Burkholderia puraquae]
MTRLTDAGDVYFRYARQALHDLAEGRRAIHDVQDLSRGSLRIAVTPTFTSYLVGPLVEAFHGRCPDVSLSVREMSQERIEALLVDDELDVGIAFDEVQTADIEAQTLLVETLALVVNRRHALAGKRKAGLRRTAVLLQRKGAYRSAAARAFVELALAQQAGKGKKEGEPRPARPRTAGR